MTEEYRKVIEEIIYKSPLSLLTIRDKETVDLIREYLPYSTGFEIECEYNNLGKESAFKDIPDIMDYPNTYDSGEIRFRIPSGIRGLICLYNISTQLKSSCSLNPLSGIHYHIDMSNYFEFLTSEKVKNLEEYILKELESWNYDGAYNPKQVRYGKGGWAGFRHSYKTLEIRIGEMTFDYELLVKRIIHCNKIVRTINENLVDSSVSDIVSKEIKDREDFLPNVESILSFIKKYHNSEATKKHKKVKEGLEELQKKLSLQRQEMVKPKEGFVDMTNIIKNRVKTNIKL